MYGVGRTGVEVAKQTGAFERPHAIVAPRITSQLRAQLLGSRLSSRTGSRPRTTRCRHIGLPMGARG
jgi:hypothetical protein